MLVRLGRLIQMGQRVAKGRRTKKETNMWPMFVRWTLCAGLGSMLLADAPVVPCDRFPQQNHHAQQLMSLTSSTSTPPVLNNSRRSLVLAMPTQKR